MKVVAQSLDRLGSRNRGLSSKDSICPWMPRPSSALPRNTLTLSLWPVSSPSPFLQHPPHSRWPLGSQGSGECSGLRGSSICHRIPQLLFFFMPHWATSLSRTRTVSFKKMFLLWNGSILNHLAMERGPLLLLFYFLNSHIKSYSLLHVKSCVYLGIQLWLWCILIPKLIKLHILNRYSFFHVTIKKKN